MESLARAWRRLGPGLRQTLTYALGTAIGRGMALVMVPITTRFLAPADYGALELLISIAEAGSVLVGFGLTDALFRFTAGRQGAERAEAAARVLGQAIMMTLAALALGQLVATLVIPALPPEIPGSALRLVLASMAFTACLQVPLAWLRLEQRAGLFLIATVLRAVLQGALCVALLAAGLGVVGVVAATATLNLALASALVWTQWRATGARLRADPAILAYGGPLVLSALCGFALGSLDRWFLLGSVSTAEIGLYGLAVKLAALVPLLLQPFELWWYPRRLDLLSQPDGKERSARAIGIGFTAILLAGIAVALGGPFLLRALTPEVYHGAAAYLPWLVLATALQAGGSLVNAGCYLRRTGIQPALVNGAAAAVTLLGYLVLIPAHGAWGAIAATLVGMVVRLLLFFHLSQRQLALPLPVGRGLGLVAGAVALVWAAGPG